LIDRGEKKLEHSGEKGIVHLLPTNKCVLPTHATSQRHEVIRDTGLN